MRTDDEGVFGITKLKRQALSRSLRSDSPLFVIQNTLFVNHLTKNYFMAFMTTIEKSQHTHQENQVTSKWKNIKQNVETCILYSSLPEIACKTVRPLTPEFRGKDGNFQNSHSRLENRDYIKGILVLVSKPENEDNIPHICHFFTQAKFLENKIYPISLFAK